MVSSLEGTLLALQGQCHMSFNTLYCMEYSLQSSIRPDLRDMSRTIFPAIAVVCRSSDVLQRIAEFLGVPLREELHLLRGVPTGLAEYGH